jgi:hypothetical protein
VAHRAAPFHSAEAGQRTIADVEQPRFAADGQRAAAHDLHPRVLLRVVRGGDADPALECELADGVIEHLRTDLAEIDDVGAAVGGSVDDRGLHRRRRHAHVPADSHVPRLEVFRVRPADRVCAFLVQLATVDAAHVVGLEHGWVEHGRIVRNRARVAGACRASYRSGSQPSPYGERFEGGNLA